MPRRIVRKVRTSRVLLVTISICAVLAILGLGALGATLLLRAQSESELRKALISNCETSPLKEAEIEDQQEAIVAPDDPQIRQLLPNVPQSVIDQIVAKGNAKHRARIAHIEDIDCEARYR